MVNRPSLWSPSLGPERALPEQGGRQDGAMRRSRQVIRLLGLLKALQDGERLHVAQLAPPFHVRRETVYRDLRALEELGFPIVGDLHGVKSRPRLASRSSPKSVSIPFTLSEVRGLISSISQRSSRYFICWLTSVNRG